MGQFSPCNINDLDQQIEEGEDVLLKFVSNNTKTWKKINENAFISKFSSKSEKAVEYFFNKSSKK